MTHKPEPIAAFMKRRKRQGEGKVRRASIKPSDNGGFIVEMDREDDAGMFLDSRVMTFSSFADASKAMNEKFGGGQDANKEKA